MKVMNIYHDSVVDGEGLRTVIFFAGCPHHCLGCHNPKSWDIHNGIEMSVNDICAEVLLNPLSNVTLSGGEPFLQAREVKKLAKTLKAKKKNIWIYSGYTYEELISSENTHVLELLSHCDVLVDGPFLLEERDISLRFRGSSNQRILSLKKLQ
ncbi:anaerobic ribonucleoside-triphosphate reductase activating protein [Bacillus spongiae]|uniref:Anaerobic ribonucleoside-triphosphate reductase-activating protein n=1 Tax=Bacillus spongiae TaxID=2683610 RepID=A0ABU8HFL2_9BACI